MFFDKVNTIAELKKAYKVLAMKNHPDLGGDEEVMKQINAEYDDVYKQIKEGIKRDSNASFDIKDDYYREVLNKLIKLPVDIELCGEWLWISGDTKPYKDNLKAVGCKWARKKKMWYWKPAWMVNKNRGGEFSIDYIRNKYGSEKIKSQGLIA